MDSTALTYPLVITFGAIAGALIRFYITEYSKRNWGENFPYGTFIINISGSLLLGFFVTISSGIFSYTKELELLIKIGFLGSYTTFSTYEWETLFLWRKNKVATTVIYWLGSSVLGVMAVYLGSFLANLLIK
jgi:fluoride exporter